MRAHLTVTAAQIKSGKAFIGQYSIMAIINYYYYYDYDYDYDYYY